MKHTVLVYNQCIGGHHPSWFVIFVHAFLKKGWRVIAVSPKAKTYLKNETKDLFIYETEYIPIQNETQKEHFYFPKSIKRLARLYALLTERYVYNWSSEKILNNLSLIKKSKKLFLFSIINFIHIILYPYRKFFCTSEYFHRGYLSSSLLSQQIRQASAAAQWDIDFIFFLYIDSLHTHPHKWGNTAIKIPWGGLLLHKPQKELIGKEAWIYEKNFQGLCFLYDDIKNLYTNKNQNKKYDIIPDLTNTDLPEDTPNILKKIIQKSQNRNILICCGSIDNRKNISKYAALINRLNSNEWFFVLIGKVHYNILNKDNLNAIRQMYIHENTFIYDKFIEDEKVLNSVINYSTVIFAAYRNFSGSSNLLCKAAAFKKPIIVSKGYLMERKVSHYKIGLSVDQDDITEMVTALNFLSEKKIDYNNFCLYCNDHSNEKFADALHIFSKKCLNHSLV